jgi:hypothetical protein
VPREARLVKGRPPDRIGLVELLGNGDLAPLAQELVNRGALALPGGVAVAVVSWQWLGGSG